MGLTRLYLAQRGLCFHCHEPMIWSAKNKRRHWLSYTKEHLLPRSKGGKGRTNIVLAHGKCNVRRGDSLPTPEMMDRAKLIWAYAVRITQGEVERFSRERAVSGTYASGYNWPIGVGEPKFIPKK